MSAFDFNDWQRQHPFTGEPGTYQYRVMPRIVCADGFQMSVQASQTHYCNPRENACDTYGSVEVGYPSEAQPELLEYAEDADAPTKTVYGFVPVGIVNAIVNKHGGLATTGAA